MELAERRHGCQTGRSPVVLRYLLVLSLVVLGSGGCATGARVISEFGSMWDGEGLRRSVPHRGVDVWGPTGAPVLAGADGEVLDVSERPSDRTSASCGRYIVLQHEVPDQLFRAATAYCHLSAATVKRGDRVKRGDVIGSIGTTGWLGPGTASPYTHVHWELMRARLEDPLKYTVGCFDPKATYPTDRFVLTYPVRC